MGFEGKLENSGLLKDAIGAIYELIRGEVVFKINNDGIFMNSMDPANVSMVIFKLLRPAFSEYKVDKEEKVTVDIERLYQVLKQAGPRDTVKLSITENKMKVTFKGELNRNFTIPLVASEGEEKKQPNLTFDATAILRADAFVQGISDAEIVNDSVVILADKDSFRMEANSEIAESKLELLANDPLLKEFKVTNASKARYAVDYLRKMLKGTKFSDNVKIQWKSDFPLQLEYNITDTLQLAFILAPRVETE